jgi:hypothetical protein
LSQLAGSQQVTDKAPEASTAGKIARKVGGVAAAAAALLTQSPVHGSQTDVVIGFLHRASITDASPDFQDLKKKLSPPLVLSPSDPTEGGLMLAGHRSHSSHSPHSDVGQGLPD